jgi:hypothetical protein
MSFWIAIAHSTASTTEGNSSSNPSPIVLTIRPPRPAMTGPGGSPRRRRVKSGLFFDPSFTIGRRRANPFSTSPAYLKRIERYYAGLRTAGALEG